MHYQKGEIHQYKEKFEKERSCLMYQLNECKIKISYCVDIEEGQRQMIIRRAEGREALLRNNLGDKSDLLK